MNKELKEAIWQLRERCCCEPEDYAAIDLIEAELKKPRNERQPPGTCDDHWNRIGTCAHCNHKPQSANE